MRKSASSSPFIPPGNGRLIVEAANFEDPRFATIRLGVSHVAILG